MKTIRRDTLMRMIDRGEMEAKRDYHMTDDYAFDAGNGFGKTSWMPVRISRPVYNDNGFGFKNEDSIIGNLNLKESQFKSKSGSAWYNADGTINLNVHSNLSYTLRKKTAKPRIKLYPTVTAL